MIANFIDLDDVIVTDAICFFVLQFVRARDYELRAGQQVDVT